MKLRLFLIFILTTMFLYTNFSFCIAGVNTAESPSEQKMFSMIITEYSSNLELIRLDLKGNINWITKNDTLEVFNIEVVSVKKTKNEKGHDILALNINPFTAKVEISAKADIPVKINIIKNKQKDAEGKLELTLQYRVIYGMISLMQKNVLKKEIVRINPDLDKLEMKVQYNDQVNIEGGKRVKSKSILDLYSPDTFSTYPVIIQGALGGWNIESSIYVEKKMKYAFFFHDEKHNMITHAVNIKANAKGNIDTDEKYINALQMLGNPKSFEHYQAQEIKIYNSN